MATRKTTARKRTTARRKKLAPRKPTARKPRRGSLAQKAAVSMATFVAKQGEKTLQTRNVRRDAAILRITHEGCPTCGGNGQIFTKKKDGSFSGSKPCPAKPKTMKVSRTRLAIESRLGPDKTSGLCGWRCPCGDKAKPRYRDAKTATAALKTHNRKKHGGASVGGTWYAQVPAGTLPKQPEKKATVSKVSVGSGLTDRQWEAQNKPMDPAAATKKGLCWQCAGKGALYSAFGGEQITTVCGECEGTGKAKAKAS